MTRPERSRREQRVRAAIKAAGLRVEPVGGTAWRVYGPGVDVRVAALAHVNAEDLRPYVETQPVPRNE